MGDEERGGAKQPKRFNPASGARLDDPARFAYLAPSAIIAMLALERNAKLVDFGTGTGTYAIEIARARRDVHVFALDEQAEMLERLASKLAATDLTNIEPIVPARLVELGGCADRILALNVLHEIGDAALHDLSALLAPLGRALFIDWNGDVERPIGPPSAHVYGVAEATRRLADRGFNVVDVTLFPYHYALTALYPGGHRGDGPLAKKSQR